MFGKYINTLRKNNNYSQQYLSDFLSVSRPTYAAMEKGETDFTISQAKKLADLYGLPMIDFIEKKFREVTIEKSQASQKEEYLRISVPQEKLETFKQVLLYVLDRVGAKPNIGETVLYKLLYFIDFDYYELYEQQLMGAKYIKNHHGPSPVLFRKLVDKMIKNNEIEVLESSYFDYQQKRYLPLSRPDLSLLSAQHIKHIDSELNRLADMNAVQISNLSHSDTPWIAAKSGEILDYEAVFYRTPKTSLRKYEE